MNTQNGQSMSREDFDKFFEELSQQKRDELWELFFKFPPPKMDYMDYASECSMCGKPIPRNASGRCSECDQVWDS